MSKLPKCLYELVLALKFSTEALLQQRKDETPCLHGAMKVVDLFRIDALYALFNGRMH